MVVKEAQFTGQVDEGHAIFVGFRQDFIEILAAMRGKNRGYAQIVSQFYTVVEREEAITD